MPGTAIHNLPYPVQIAAGPGPDVPADVKALADSIDPKLTPASKGLLAARPAFGKVGQRYYATDVAGGTEYLDIGTAWVAAGPPKAGDGINVAADLSLSVKLHSVPGLAFFAGGLYVKDDNSTLETTDTLHVKDGGITGAKIANALKPSQGAAAGTEALRALGTTAGTAAAGNDSRFPTAGEKAALAGGRGAPGAANEYTTYQALLRSAAYRRAQVTATSNGVLTFDAQIGVKWTNQISFMPIGREGDVAALGYWDLNMPANGETIQGVGGAPNRNVTGGLIPLGQWESLFVVLPPGGASVLGAADLRLVHYSVNFQVPENWIPVAILSSGAPNYVRWITGQLMLAGTSAPGWSLMQDTGWLGIGDLAGATIPFINNWGRWTSALGGPYDENAGFRKLEQTIHLRGAVLQLVAGNRGAAMFTLPAGYRPGKNMEFIVKTRIAGGATNSPFPIMVQTDGVVRPIPGENTRDGYYLDSITFPAN